MVESFRGKRVFVTGHTGFKGSWLCLWLERLGAEVFGFALDPEGENSLFECGSVATVLSGDTRADLADLSVLASALADARPEVVFHLAAQPLVRLSYEQPLETFATNAMGTANLLEAVRGTGTVRAVVVVTTDKVYENKEWVHPYREGDRLGGRDPYSASKAAAEIVTDCYRSSYFKESEVRVATARAGNVLGGGDWAVDRLVPDCLRAFAAGDAVRLRYPHALRPWQHVLDPLHGYLVLAARLLNGGGAEGAWNFGPSEKSDASVGEVAERLADLWGSGAKVEILESADNAHEAGLLRLDSSRSRMLLQWNPRWELDSVLRRTVSWHQAWASGRDGKVLCLEQIRDFEGGLEE